MALQSKKVALVTGGNRGIGFELCRQLGREGLSVILTARNQDQGRGAAQKLAAEGLSVEFQELDVKNLASVQSVADWVSKTYGRLDYLVNNAGVFLDQEKGSKTGEFPSILKVSPDTIRNTMDVNLFGAIRMIQTFVPLMVKNHSGRIINISSGMGQLSEMNGGYPGYRISKTALNAVTKILADEMADQSVTVASVCPGWVKTDMGGEQAELPVSEAVKHLVQTVLEDKRSGVFLRFGEEMAW